jgi:16S rRNA A1518/A1519 N6-dimethyltransferase RsmA/KsgA/DIM1 with predicted DNA glycosylase/AP lyase activity
VVEADARSLPLPRVRFRVVANPPYGITGDLLHLLLNAGPRL